MWIIFPDQGWDRLAHQWLERALSGAEAATSVPGGLFEGLSGLAFTVAQLSRGGLRDIGVMQSMVTSALSFLSGSSSEEENEWFDLGALLATLCDEFEEVGATTSYEGPEQIRFFCRPNAINRALTNLIENGIHFGERVEVKASTGDDAIVVDAADDGPGIPVERVQDVLEPFVRLDPSRSNRPGSVGLGLSIVKEIVAAHKGTLELIERKPQGLIARMTFPAPP